MEGAGLDPAPAGGHDPRPAVGEEVLAAFSDVEGVSSGRMLDLTAVGRAQLAEAGVGEIRDSGLCTSCEQDLFYSHRRDGERTGRQAGLVWLS